MHGELATLPAIAVPKQTVVVATLANPVAPADSDDGLLGQALPVVGVAYAAMFLAGVMTFWSSGAALFAVLISAGYTMMYFGVPLWMAWVRRSHDERWVTRTDRATTAMVDTYTGPLKRWEAVLQMVLIPIAVSVTFIAFCVIWVIQTG